MIERHGVAPEALTQAAWHRAFRRAGFWLAFARGALVMAAALAVSFWFITGRPTLPVISGVWLMQAGQLSARAWVIRRAAGAQIT